MALGRLYTSSDFGSTWTLANPPLSHWSSVASSADGTKLAAAVYGGRIYTFQQTPFSLSPSLKLASSAGNSTLSWIVPSAKFGLQQKTERGSSSWSNVLSQPVLTGVEYQVTIPQTGSSAFYRLVSQ